MNSIKILPLLISLMICQSAIAQFGKKDSSKIKQIEKNLELWGTIKKEGLPLEGALVILKVNDRIIKDSTRTDVNGKFSMKMDFGYLFTMSFGMEEYVSKKIEISTIDIPEEDKNTGYETGGFEVELFRRMEGIDYAIYNEPIGRISYDKKYRQFTYDRKYIKEKGEKVKVFEQELAIKQKEFEAEEQNSNNQYYVLIRDADIEFEARDYTLAKEYYEEALKLKAAEVYPKNRIVEINKINNQQSRQISERYAEYLQLADAAYQTKDWEEARKNYVEALAVKSDENYPKEKIKELTAKIDEISRAEKQKELADQAKIYTLKDIPIPKEKERFAMELARKYPQGLTENETTEGGRKVLQRIIVDGNKGVEYKRVTHNWGGVYYFRNGEPISQYSWNKETD